MKKHILLMSVVFLGAASLIFAQGTAHWEYSGEAGPSNWGSLDPSYSVCSSGKNQSPVDLGNFIEADLKPIAFSYKSGGNEIVNNGHTVQVNFVDGGGITVDGHVFDLKQFHFHVPSENLIAGKSFPMEAHFVHADSSGNLAVIAVLFEEGASHPGLAKIFKKIPHSAGEKQPLSPLLSADALMPANKDYYRFNGSLTTPPCTEGVLWLVMKQPVTASKDQINQMMAVLHHPNNRPVQPINARMIAQ